jgi:DNA replication protein DnaC
MTIVTAEQVGERSSITLTCPMCGDSSRRALLANEQGEPYLESTIQMMNRWSSEVICAACERKATRSSAGRVAMERRKQAQDRSIIAPGMLAARFDTSDPAKVRAHQEQFEIALDYDGTRTLWIQGLKGTGKTWVAHCIMNAWLDEGGSVGEVNSSEICILSRMYGSRIEVRIAEYVGVGLLLIDDIDSAEWTAAAVDILRDVVDKRRAAHRPIIVTSQRTGAATKTRMRELTNHVTAIESLMDRFMPFKSVTMLGGSFRAEEQMSLSANATPAEIAPGLAVAAKTDAG